LLYDLRLADGTEKPWTVDVGPERAVAYPGRSPDPAVTMRVAVADFVRIAAHDLDPGKALMTGRLQFDGNLAMAMRLGEMFGETSAL
jgi:putative sterol carrier protein